MSLPLAGRRTRSILFLVLVVLGTNIGGSKLMAATRILFDLDITAMVGVRVGLCNSSSAFHIPAAALTVNRCYLYVGRLRVSIFCIQTNASFTRTRSVLFTYRFLVFKTRCRTFTRIRILYHPDGVADLKEIFSEQILSTISFLILNSIM